MKKYILTIMLFSLGFAGYAQVGIGTANPQTTLHVVGNAGDTPGALNAIDGITVPVVTDDMTTTATNGTKISQLVYSTHASSTGYYHWNGTAWRALIKTAPSVRVTDSNSLSNSDLNGYIICTNTGSVTFDLSTLNPSAGDTITFRDAGGNIQVTNINSQDTRTVPLSGNNGTISYIYVVDDITSANTGWWNINAL